MQRVKIPGLTLDEGRIELAFQDDAYVYVCRLTPRPGAPADPTKLVYDIKVWLWTDSNGDGRFDGDAELGTRINSDGIVIQYNDPAVGSVADPLEQRFLATVASYVTNHARPWADSITKVPKLHLILDDAGLPAPATN